MSLTPDEEWRWHAFVRQWNAMATIHSDPNPFPRFRLFRWLPA